MISANAHYWILLTQALGYDNPKFKKLSELYSDISLFFKDIESEARLCGLFTVHDIVRLLAIKPKNAQPVLRRCEQLGYSVLSIDDPAYPECLYHIYAPPAVLYIWGELPDIDEALSVGIVGTRRASRYGVENSYKFGYALSKYDTVVVSGGALGVDCASHRGALAANGVTVCVRGCGINYPYLQDNAGMRRAITKRGAVISEYPPDEPPRNYYFPSRNRIIAALSDGVLLIEAGERSGSLITANLALEMGKDVFALLGNNSPQNKGSNQRIKENSAYPVTDFMDILVHYNNAQISPSLYNENDISFADISAVPVKRAARQYQTPPAPKPQQSAPKPKKQLRQPVHQNVHLEGDAKTVYEYLGAQPVHIDKIADDLKLPVFRVNTALTLLEMQGLIHALSGRQFVLK